MEPTVALALTEQEVDEEFERMFSPLRSLSNPFGNSPNGAQYSVKSPLLDFDTMATAEAPSAVAPDVSPVPEPLEMTDAAWVSQDTRSFFALCNSVQYSTLFSSVCCFSKKIKLSEPDSGC